MDFFTNKEIEIFHTSTILYMRRTGAYGKENYVLMEKFKDWLNTHNLYDDHTAILAIPLDNPNRTEPQNCRYDVCITAPAGTEIGYGNVKLRQLEGGEYMVFQIEHTAQAVQKAWETYSIELEKSNVLQDTSRPMIERYAKKLVDHHSCELCIPIL